MYGPDMAELAFTNHDGIDCRCKFQCYLPQYETQRTLEAHLASLGGPVERGIPATFQQVDVRTGIGIECAFIGQVNTTVR